MFDSELTLLEYWLKFSPDMQDLRGWADSTLRDYSRLIKLVGYHLPEIPISQLSFEDLRAALCAIRDMKSIRKGNTCIYTDASMRKFQTVLWNVFTFAQTREDAANICDLFPRMNSLPLYKNGSSVFFDPTVPRDIAVAKVKAILEKYPHYRKSLSMNELRKLYTMIETGIEADGRYAGMALMIFSGVRPRECRAICWRDIEEFIDEPNSYYLKIYKSINRQNIVDSSMKTPNAYRKIPIHKELGLLLKKRWNFIKSLGATQDSYICCMMNNFDMPCPDHLFANLTKTRLHACITNTVMADLSLSMAADMISEDQERSADEFRHLSLYILRKSFCTWLFSSTELDEMERLYLMGHKMLQSRKDLRPIYNDEDRLQLILQKMNRFVLFPEKYFCEKELLMDNLSLHSFQDTSYAIVRIPPSMLTNACSLHLHIEANESNDSVKVELLTPLRGVFSSISATVAESHCPSIEFPTEILTEFDSPAIAQACRKAKFYGNTEDMQPQDAQSIAATPLDNIS